MMFTHTRSIRFLVFWLGFFLLGHILVISSIYMTAAYTPDSLYIAYATTVFLPVLSLLFGWLFFRGIEKLSKAAVWEMSIGWILLLLVFGALLSSPLYGVPWFIGLTDPISISMNVLIFALFLLAGFLRYKKIRRGVPEVDMLHPGNS